MRDTDDRPNIVLINCDDLGYSDLGCYGSRANRTPHLDRMATEGTRFTDFYMAAPVCSPSRGAMMTGCYPKRIGFADFEGRWVLFPGQGVGLGEDEITVADVLRQGGYATMHIGKWHCGDQPAFLPTRHGFDHYYGLPFSNDMGRQIGREGYPPLPLLADEEVIQQQPDQTSLTERYVEKAVQFVRENRDRPFFLYFAHVYVHLPIYAPERFLRDSANGSYGAAVACVDWAAGLLLRELAELEIDRNTLVLFTSDNGSRGSAGGSNQPLRGGKGTTWEGGQRLPLIANWPGRIPAGRTCSELVTSMDLLPTFAGLAGVPVPDDRILDGRDIGDILRGTPNARSPHRAFFYYFREQLDAVRSGPWKLHVRKRDRDVLELYNLTEDLGESRNLADLHPDVVARLQGLLDEARDDLGDSATGAPGRNCRPIGRVENPTPLTQYDESYPYICAMYDIKDAG